MKFPGNYDENVTMGTLAFLDRVDNSVHAIKEGIKQRDLELQASRTKAVEVLTRNLNSKIASLNYAIDQIRKERDELRDSEDNATVYRKNSDLLHEVAGLVTTAQEGCILLTDVPGRVRKLKEELESKTREAKNFAAANGSLGDTLLKVEAERDRLLARAEQLKRELAEEKRKAEGCPSGSAYTMGYRDGARDVKRRVTGILGEGE